MYKTIWSYIVIVSIQLYYAVILLIKHIYKWGRTIALFVFYANLIVVHVTSIFDLSDKIMTNMIWTMK